VRVDRTVSSRPSGPVVLEGAIRREINFVHAAPARSFSEVLLECLLVEDRQKPERVRWPSRTIRPWRCRKSRDSRCETWSEKLARQENQATPTFFGSILNARRPFAGAWRESACYWGHSLWRTGLAFSCDGRFSRFRFSRRNRHPSGKRPDGRSHRSTKGLLEPYGNDGAAGPPRTAIVTGVACSPGGSRVAYCRTDGRWSR